MTSDIDNCSCCCEPQGGEPWPDEGEKWQKGEKSRARRFLGTAGNCCICTLRCVRRWIKRLVEHKYFQQGILLAILINTLSMGIEYHNQVMRSKEKYSLTYAKNFLQLLERSPRVSREFSNEIKYLRVEVLFFSLLIYDIRYVSFR